MASERRKAARLAAWYNAVPNVLWSVLGFAPVVAFGYGYMERAWLYGLLAPSLLAYLLPTAWLRRLQLSQSAGVYRQLRVHRINRITQNGALVNARLRQRFPGFRQVQGRASAERHVRASYHLERFHLVLLLFFLGCTLYAAAHGRWGWALLMLLANIGYNLYPIWLQQYLRLRLAAAAGQHEPGAGPAESHKAVL
ncbi:glycosyl-4,4'-diaponeurosporenoate acyltransferase CrtO family protein [Hymenobacter latericus]|uniref:glycosyl-4,4'-diaponeurosporenoate acyltransferase CrtO family protein n=1 Tax=Hymenobacter sp. YIM 151858-1 TaxID=2987688 RepID=UPI0022265D97|nr:hypothetical protein [Hymenobacter sp. YIM 151858-1]UYZ58239.1 hypothetical protein OIS50_14380 [Hymenobacter sp. YIM 151858-1]